MGCAPSKSKKVCRNCQSPVRRSNSVHVRLPLEKSGHSYHQEALTSSTLDSLTFDQLNRNRPLNQSHSTEDEIPSESVRINKEKATKDDFKMEMIEAKTWSKMINEKIPKVIAKTPTRTPPGEPELIDVWELMEGLEDSSSLKPPHHFRSFSFQIPHNPNLSILDEQTTPRLKENGETSSNAFWPELTDNNQNSNSNDTSAPVSSLIMTSVKENVEDEEEASISSSPEMSDDDSNSNSNDTSVVSEFDPEVISTLRKTLEELPPANPFHLESLAGKDQLLEATDDDHYVNGSFVGNKVLSERLKDRVILYYTSLRGVRKTYEDCFHIRLIFKGLSVKVDERDVSMHSGFKAELKELLGEGYRGGLPRVFVGRKYIGGAEEIRQMHEEGRLAKMMMESCELVEDHGIGQGKGICEACGDIRFLPCETCSGSCKIYFEADFDEEYDQSEQEEYGFQTCPDCNENGLVRCPICCD